MGDKKLLGGGNVLRKIKIWWPELLMLFLITLSISLTLHKSWVHSEQVKDFQEKEHEYQETIDSLDKQNTLLQEENQYLNQRIKELEEQQELQERFDNFFETFGIKHTVITAYAPLDPKAVEGMCYSGNPEISASGERVIPGETAAGGYGFNFGDRVFIQGEGMVRINDRGGGLSRWQIDRAVRTRSEALEWGRRQLIVIYEKSS